MAGIRRGEAGKPPPIPLRYRIDPTAKKLDDLDDLEGELRRNESDYEPDDFEAMLDKLQRQRAGIIKARDKHLPPEIEEPPPRTLEECIRDNVTPKAFKWVLFILIIIWLYFKNSS